MRDTGELYTYLFNLYKSKLTFVWMWLFTGILLFLW